MSTKVMIPNIYIVGAQSTGKTTLVNRLKLELSAFLSQAGLAIDEPQIISEVARTVMRENRFMTEEIRDSPERSLALQKLILSAQLESEETALSKGSWFISDRSGIDPVVYAWRYVGPEQATEMRQSVTFRELQKRMVPSLIVVCEAGTAWLQNDGFRLMPETHQDWLQLHQIFCTLLDELNLPYVVIPSRMSALSDRAELVLSQWRELLGRWKSTKEAL
jgi:nicotinamide riboside kinase